MPKIRGDSPDPIDVHVGLRVRGLRKERGLSQAQLGSVLGIAFQQVQKYENGTNRLSASTLAKAAHALGVAPGTLFPEDGDPTPRKPEALNALAQTRGAEELVESYARIQSVRLRRVLLDLARSLAENGGDVSEDSEARPIPPSPA